MSTKIELECALLQESHNLTRARNNTRALRFSALQAGSSVRRVELETAASFWEEEENRVLDRISAIERQLAA